MTTHELVGDDEDLAARRIDDGRAGDPTVGAMLPQGKSVDGTAVARCRDQTTEPRDELSA